MKYTLKGLEFNIKGISNKEGNFDANIKIQEVQLEGNFEEVMKSVIEISKLSLKK